MHNVKWFVVAIADPCSCGRGEMMDIPSVDEMNNMQV